MEDGGNLTAHAWDGETGGVVFFRALTVTVEAGGSIDVSGKGYRGGLEDHNHAFQFSYVGEGYLGGYGTRGRESGSGGGGGGYTDGNNNYASASGGGGGGGYGTTGADGAIVHGNDTRNGLGGEEYGLPNLSQLLVGSGGGSGGHDMEVSSRYGGAGGAGGGIIFIDADAITVDGAITADGEDGGPTSGGYVGGGGAGGSVWLRGEDLVLGESHVTAVGGLGQSETAGVGGVGRIRLDYSSLEGTTEPAPGFTSGIGSPP